MVRDPGTGSRYAMAMRSPRAARLTVFLALFLALLSVPSLAACGGGGSSSSSSSSTPVGSSSSAATTQAASASITIDGTARTGLTVRCDFPDVAGASIAVLGDGLRIGLFADKVTVQLFSTDSTNVFHQRQFEGSGVSAFGERRGAQLDATVAEVPASTGTPGSLGTVSKVSGSVDCHGQDPGTSHLTIDGASLEHARVECNSSGNEVITLGILNVSTQRVFTSVALRPEGISVVESRAGQGSQSFQAPAGTASITATGGHANGDAVDKSAASSTALHIEGDVACGTPV